MAVEEGLEDSCERGGEGVADPGPDSLSNALSSLAVGRLVARDKEQYAILRSCLCAFTEYVGDGLLREGSPEILQNVFLLLDNCMRRAERGPDAAMARSALLPFAYSGTTEGVLRRCFAHAEYGGGVVRTVEAVWNKWRVGGQARGSFEEVFRDAKLGRQHGDRSGAKKSAGGEFGRDLEQYEQCLLQLHDLYEWLSTGGRDSSKAPSQIKVFHSVLFKTFVLSSVITNNNDAAGAGALMTEDELSKFAYCQELFDQLLGILDGLSEGDPIASAWCPPDETSRTVLGEIREFVNNKDLVPSGVEFWRGKFMQERETRRKTHEQLQQLRGNIRVLCRVRPLLGDASENVATTMPLPGMIRLRKSKRNIDFEYNSCFGGDSTQEEVFEEILPLVMSFVDGYNACIFAYGQTGSGKTFTMQGTNESPGIAPRVLHFLFQHSRQSQETGVERRIEFSMLEVYNEGVKDLMSSASHKNLDICALGPHQLGPNMERVPGLTKKTVTRVSEIEALIEQGTRKRATTSHSLNDHSSRSHAVISIRYCDANDAEAPAPVLHLVDLAGSERVAKSGVQGVHLKEAQAINKSLSALGDVIASLQQKSSHTPYRNSKLTQLLQDSLSGNSKVLMVCNISPEESSASETMSSLNFAKRANQVEAGQAKRVTSGATKAGKPKQQQQANSLNNQLRSPLSNIANVH